MEQNNAVTLIKTGPSWANLAQLWSFNTFLVCLSLNLKYKFSVVWFVCLFFVFVFLIYRIHYICHSGLFIKEEEKSDSIDFMHIKPGSYMTTEANTMYQQKTKMIKLFTSVCEC